MQKWHELRRSVNSNPTFKSFYLHPENIPPAVSASAISGYRTSICPFDAYYTFTPNHPILSREKRATHRVVVIDECTGRGQKFLRAIK